jgi:hypothetical protein
LAWANLCNQKRVHNYCGNRSYGRISELELLVNVLPATTVILEVAEDELPNPFVTVKLLAKLAPANSRKKRSSYPKVYVPGLKNPAMITTFGWFGSGGNTPPALLKFF